MERSEVVERFRIHKNDTASICVEIGLLSDKIFALENQLRTLDQKNPYFLICRFHLIRKTGARRKLLDLLKSSNTNLHNHVLEKIKKWYSSEIPLSLSA